MPKITINANDFLQGMSFSDALADRGFSPDSKSLNLLKERGKLYFRESQTEISTAPTDPIIASCPDPEVGGKDLFFVDDEGAFYTLDGTTLTKTATGTQEYTYGTTDIMVFMNKVYATAETAIMQLDNALGSLQNWWDGLASSYRHPMERVEDELFIANGNVIYYWNGTSSGTAFTLPDGQAVTSLRRHPDGRTLLAFTSGDRELNYSHTKSASGNVYYLNPTLRGFDREVVLTAQVEGTRNLGGVIFCTWGNNIGYFDGNALRFLRKIEDSSYIYSQGLKAIEDILIYIDGQNVIGYGDLGAGNVFFPMFTQGTYDLTHLAYQGGNRLLVSHSNAAGAGVLAVIDYDNTGAYGTFYSNKIDFGDQAVISKIVLLHDTTATGGTTNIRIFERDLNGTLNTIERVAHSGVSNNRTEVHCGGLKRDIFQLVLQPEDDDIGYRSIQIHYDRIR